MDVSFPSAPLFAEPAAPPPRPASLASSSSSYSSASTSGSAPERGYVRALERELARAEAVVAAALGETFRAREREAAWRRRVGELEAVLGVDGGGDGEGLGVRLGALVAERDGAVRVLEEVRRVVGGAGRGGGVAVPG